MARRPPKYSLHKASGQALIRLRGKCTYLGVHGTPDSLKRYAEEIERWQREADFAPKNLTIGQLTLLYSAHARKYYVKNGKLTSKFHVVRAAMKAINSSCRSIPATEFSPRKFKAVREDLILSGRLCRSTINDYMGIIRRMIKWAVADEILPVERLIALQAVPDLRQGRAGIRETPPVTPVPDDQVDAITQHVPPKVWAMIELQRLTGMRPGEVLIMRGCDIYREDNVWEYRPSSHKMEHKNHDRIVLLGQQAQEILQPWLVTDSYLFPAKNGIDRPYRRDTYSNAIKRGCEKAFGMPGELRNVGRHLKKLNLDEKSLEAEKKRLSQKAAAWREQHCWSPNQLRHNFATRARREFGIEATRVTLGHSSAVTSEIYAERDLNAARAVVSKIG